MTTVRDLVDIAAAELDVLSCRLTLGEEIPRPQDMAYGWSLLLPAAQHLVRQSAGPFTHVARAELRELDLLQAPGEGIVGAAPVGLEHAAHAMGAVGDLLSTARVRPAAAERYSLLSEAMQLLTAAAEVTLHGVGTSFEHSQTLMSAAAAGGVSRRLAQRLGDRPQSTSMRLTDIGVPAPALPVRHPLGSLAHAVHEWRQHALRVATEPGLSSHDLRGAALVAGQLTAACRCLLALGPPDATAPTHAELDRSGRAWTHLAQQWTTFVLPGSKDLELPGVSWQVMSELRRALMPTGHWVSATASDVAFTPAVTVALRRAIELSLRDVAAAHSTAVRAASDSGRLVLHVQALPEVARLGDRRHRWVPAPRGSTYPILAAYVQVAESFSLPRGLARESTAAMARARTGAGRKAARSR